MPRAHHTEPATAHPDELAVLRADPEIGDLVHYVPTGSGTCAAAIITRICPTIDGIPTAARCDLTTFPPMQPTHTNINAADYDPHRAGGTWHHRGHQ